MKNGHLSINDASTLHHLLHIKEEHLQLEQMKKVSVRFCGTHVHFRRK